MSAADAAQDAKPWYAFDFNLINLLTLDERGLWGMAKSAKDNFQAGRAAGATGKGAWHFALALGATALLGATFIPGEGAEVQAVAKAGRSNLLSALTSRVRQLAGFRNEGTPLILDENVMVKGLADALRAKGYNVRTVEEIFGRRLAQEAGVADAEIAKLARMLEGRVITNNVKDFGRQLSIPLRTTKGLTADGVAQFIEYYLK